MYYCPSASSRAVGQAILPAAAFQAALGCGHAALYYYPSVSSRAATIWSYRNRAARVSKRFFWWGRRFRLPRPLAGAAFFGCGYAALWGRIVSCSRFLTGLFVVGSTLRRAPIKSALHLTKLPHKTPA
jgi:hypothetical protein